MDILRIEISPEQHQKIQAIAALKGKSIKDLILNSVFKQANDEDLAWEKFSQLFA